MRPLKKSVSRNTQVAREQTSFLHSARSRRRAHTACVGAAEPAEGLEQVPQCENAPLASWGNACLRGDAAAAAVSALAFRSVLVYYNTLSCLLVCLAHL